MNTNTIKDTIQGVIDGLTPLAQKMQVPLEKLFGWAIRENYVRVIIDFIWIILLIGLIIGWTKLLKYGLSHKKLDNGELSDDNQFYYHDSLFPTCVSIAVLIGIVTFLIIIIGIPDIISRLVNPEYNALKDLVSIVITKGH